MISFFLRWFVRLMHRHMQKQVAQSLQEAPLKIPNTEKISPNVIDDIVNRYVLANIKTEAISYQDLLRCLVIENLQSHGYSIVAETTTDTVESPFCFKRATADNDPQVKIPKWVGS